MTDSEYKITQPCGSTRPFSHSYSETSRGTLVLPSNMFLFGDFDYIRYYLAMDSGTQLFDPLFCSNKGFLSEFNMSVWAKQNRRGDSWCSALTQEWTGLYRPKSPDLAALSGHRENPLSLSHINGQRVAHKKGTPPSSSPLNSLTLAFTPSLPLLFPISPFFQSIKVILSVTCPLSLSLWFPEDSHLLRLKTPRLLTRWKRKQYVPDSQYKIAHSLPLPLIIIFFSPLSLLVVF